jgi:hypothetical protein
MCNKIIWGLHMWSRIRFRKSIDRQYNFRKKKNKRTNNDIQNITQKTKDRATRTPLKTVGGFRWLGRVSNLCTTYYKNKKYFSLHFLIVFYVIFCRLVFVFLSFFCWPWYFFFRFTTSAHPFDIFNKLFSSRNK